MLEFSAGVGRRHCSFLSKGKHPVPLDTQDHPNQSALGGREAWPPLYGPCGLQPGWGRGGRPPLGARVCLRCSVQGPKLWPAVTAGGALRGAWRL